jgi:putative anaerobic ribonucleoside-triphosphate reductase activating protein
MEDLYFKDTESKLIFGLLELKDRQQLDFLGIDCEHFYDRNIAKEWYEKNKVILENSKHELKDRALGMLYQLYETMIA